jgi:hypothetical protein
LAEKLGFKNGDFEPWYKLTNKDVIRHGGSVFLRQYDNSLRKALTDLFPEHHWDFTKHGHKFRSYWRSDENKRSALLEIGQKLGIESNEYEKWYKINSEEIMKHGGRTLIEYFKSSISKLVTTVFKEHNWDLTQFAVKPRHYWSKLENQMRFVEEFRKKLKIKPNDYEAWYNLTNMDFKRNGGAVILGHFNSSMLNLLRGVMPEHNWDPSRFTTKPRHHWSAAENQREFFLKLGKSLGIKEGDYEPWYKLKYATLKKYGGSGLLFVNDNSILNALISAFPEHKWDSSKFVNKPKNYWSIAKNQKAFVDKLAKSLGIKEGDYNAWYKLTVTDVLKEGGAGVRTHFPTTVSLLTAIFPEHDWKPWKFHNRTEYARNHEIVKQAVEYLKFSLSITEPTQWYRVTRRPLQELEIIPFIKSAGGLSEMLRIAYPEHSWEDEQFYGYKLKSKENRRHKKT